MLEDVVLLDPANALIHHAEGAALLVVGRGSGGDAGFVQTLLREARCPVSIMPEA
ncbi:hypothetical protein ACIBJF_45010 [Streptomyces sp. NPDC050743]|uniref:hypothetical protein n=1 Tax=Streptomyces sp. NPDC050743 TaxID=3365634 RepID=UPI0037BCA708